MFVLIVLPNTLNVLLQVEENRQCRVHTYRNTITGSTVFRNSRSVFWRHQSLARGRYVIIPCVFEPSVVGQYLLRTFAGSAIGLRRVFGGTFTSSDHLAEYNRTYLQLHLIFICTGPDVKLYPHFHCHWQLFVLMCM